MVHEFTATHVKQGKRHLLILRANRSMPHAY